MSLDVRVHPHAAERAHERGASIEEIEATVLNGERFAARLGRSGFRHDFVNEAEWRGSSSEVAMEVTFDAHHNIAYIRFRERTTGIETVRISDELNIDLTPDGSVYGIELLNAHEQITALGDTLLLEDASTGQRIEVHWPGDAA